MIMWVGGCWMHEWACVRVSRAFPAARAVHSELRPLKACGAARPAVEASNTALPTLPCRHCVYDVATGKYQANFVFYPGRHGGVGHADNAFAWSWVSTWWNNAYTQGLCPGGSCSVAAYRYDVALLKLKPNAAGVYAGNKFGWFGFGELACLSCPGCA